jgi:hypothetical protein
MQDIPIRVIAITAEFANTVRNSRKAPQYGHPAHQELAGGYGPCRHCLKPFSVGQEDRILFTYNPFLRIGDVPFPGPVYIHAEECSRYEEDAGYPEQLRQYASVVTAYGDKQKLVAEQHIENGEQPTVVQNFLSDPQVRYVHVRDKSAGCFDFRIERLESVDEEEIQEHKC